MNTLKKILFVFIMLISFYATIQQSNHPQLAVPVFLFKGEQFDRSTSNIQR
jgi:hypothetical protein